MALASYAMDAAKSRGRRYPELSHPYRNDFARDRDRVIHSRAFRRLEAKTQVFTTRYSDHFRNRLTHTLEVAQIARTVAGALQLNADLAEALALVHDIGHPPFGHLAEQVLGMPPAVARGGQPTCERGREPSTQPAMATTARGRARCFDESAGGCLKEDVVDRLFRARTPRPAILRTGRL